MVVQDSVPVDVATTVEVPVTGPVVVGTEPPGVTDPEAVPVGPTDPVDIPTVVAPVPEGEPLPDVDAVALPVLVEPPLGGTAVDEDLPEQLRVRVGLTTAEDDGTTT